MFTGIIQAIGKITGLERRASDVRITVDIGSLAIDEVSVGDSIAVDGVCLTAVQIAGNAFIADVSNETLSRTTLQDARVGTAVNLELAVTPTTRMGGHIVSGHVDGIGKIREKHEDGRSIRFRIGLPRELLRYVAVKGSICVDGVSLTVNEVDEESFHVNIIPHTLSATTLGAARAGRKVNLEVDLVARYVERLLAEGITHPYQIDLETLEKAGFF
ncbi:MAG: riboflavin synthase [Gammaproteobacteria bacterium]